MEAIAEARSVYLEDFEANGAPGPAWSRELQRHGIERFEALGFPTRRMEAWRKTDLTAVTGVHFQRPAGPGAVPPELARRAGELGEGHRLVFVDGYLDAGLSDLGELPPGVTVTPFSAYGERAPERLISVLGSRADVDGNPFVALNTAFFRDGVFIRAARGALAERPIVVVHLLSPEADKRAVLPRLAVTVEAGAELRLAEHFLGADEPAALVCPVTEIQTDQGAVVDYYRVQEEGAATLHLGAVHAALARDANASLYSLAAGARLARVDIHADLEGIGSEATLNGLYLTDGRQFCDHHTWVNHRQPHGTSRQRFKGVLLGRSEAVFDGLVKVFEGARKTDAAQENRNLVLGKLALAHSNPRLEIYNDDVKCAHGSTVGELDDDALLYLRSRGVGPRDAQGMLTFAFANEMLKPVRLPGIHDHLRRLLFQRLPGDETVRDMP